MKTFDFGENWINFSEKSLKESDIEEARESLLSLIGQDAIEKKTFLDIGSGSGIFSIAAKKNGATKVVGFDVSKKSVKSALLNKERFAKEEKIDYFKQSILEEGYNRWGKFDVVYSWGVLHHTGEMWEAIRRASSLVSKEGYFVIAIYNKHWTSTIWKVIKYFYNVSPKFARKFIIVFFYYLKKIFFEIFNRDVLNKKRGMDFYFDIIDWVGGYPYEYASKKEVVEFLKDNEFKLVRFLKTKGWTGCNEFVFLSTKKGRHE